MNTAGFVRLLNSSMSLMAFPRFVPEGESLPAASFTHVSNVRRRVVLSGNVDSTGDTWRVTLVCENLTDLPKYIKELELIDNTSNSDFKNIFVESIFDGRDVNTDNADFFEAYVDVRVIDRR